MWSYECISDASNVPAMTDLGSPGVLGPNSPGGVSQLTFLQDFGHDFVRYEPAVGVRCKVVRTNDDGVHQERGGAVLSVQPLRVSLDGAGWQ
jgi:hypothetical protein